MKVIAKNIYENGQKPDVWEVEDHCQTWGLFIEDIQTDSIVTDYYDFVGVNERGIVVFVSKFVDEEWGRITRTYQLKR